MNNKKHVIYAVLGILTLMIITVVINILSSNTWKKYDVSLIENEMFRFYNDRGIRTMDFVDMTSLFAVNFEDQEDAVYLTNINPEVEINSETMIIIVMNTDDPTYYYDIFRSHLDSYMMYSDNEDLLKLYNNAILVKGDNYIYFIVDKEASIIEKEINMYYN